MLNLKLLQGGLLFENKTFHKIVLVDLLAGLFIF